MTGGTRDNDRRRDEGFVRDVLARTSGPACDRACGQLPDLVDGLLTGLDRDLVQGHLEHCAGCRQVAVVLGWLTPALPAMAAIDPGPAFTAAVLARTSDRRQQAAALAEPGGAAGLMDRLGRWWETQILRPGFPAQVAYVATIVLVLLTVTPGSPIKDVPGKALSTMQAGGGAIPVVGPALNNASTWLDARGASALAGISADLRGRWHRTESSLARRFDRSGASRTELAAYLDQTLTRIRDGELGQATYELFSAGKAAGRAWTEWWTEDDDDDQ
jgi:hypothetical protein